MRLRAITAAAAILWGGCMLAVGLINLAAPSYGADFLRLMSSIYPGFHDSRTIGQVLLGTIYGFVDGAIAGYFFGLLYRWTAGNGSPAVVASARESAPLGKAA